MICGTLEVPLDYADQTFIKTLTPQLVKIPAIQKPHGNSVLLNFGGPREDSTVYTAALGTEIQAWQDIYTDVPDSVLVASAGLYRSQCYKTLVERVIASMEAPSYDKASNTVLGWLWAAGTNYANACYARMNETGSSQTERRQPGAIFHAIYNPADWPDLLDSLSTVMTREVNVRASLSHSRTRSGASSVATRRGEPYVLAQNVSDGLERSVLRPNGYKHGSIAHLHEHGGPELFPAWQVAPEREGLPAEPVLDRRLTRALDYSPRPNISYKNNNIRRTITIRLSLTHTLFLSPPSGSMAVCRSRPAESSPRSCPASGCDTPVSLHVRILETAWRDGIDGWYTAN
ncbi:hypothetical protein N7474_010512 [Penicillium riverlandense]|uniref:uncharacterized protein n=1 Tax=Penicillium riverlandense TaxID=1903569 RepID=UPI002548041D|nr:uncharacterized protein N7474_010512 [Penicillium riverlandense]KAJ5806920.1 hypothetical protein N7474_010512 [Penicillium riverlandense]